MVRPNLPIGTSDFRQLRKEGLYYVDKSLLAEEIMNDTARVILLPRPRRFGKTLNLSMLRYFFDNTQDHSQLFEALAITQSSIWKYQGQLPVIFVTLKDCKGSDWPTMQVKLAQSLQPTFQMHKYLLDQEDLWEGDEREQFQALSHGKANLPTMEQSLLLLSTVLHRHFDEEVVILMDEYDSGLIHAYSRGFYTEMRDTLRELLSKGLKDNTYLKKGIVTGILRIAKESLFSGINNLVVGTVLDHNYTDKFGLTPEEVQQLLADFDMAHNYDQIDHWYNGYCFGDQQIYNPWSILHYVRTPKNGFIPYWVNTSQNNLIFEQLAKASYATIALLETMMQGHEVQATLYDHTVFQDLEHPTDKVLFTFLVFSGYLNATKSHQERRKVYYTLRIPNEEVLAIYEEGFLRPIERYYGESGTQLLFEQLLIGDLASFETTLKDYVLQVFSYHDVQAPQPEAIYHGFMMGLFSLLFPTHKVSSNREAGLGRADMLVVPRDAQDRRAYVLEFKRAENPEGLEATAQQALDQIAGRQYTAELQAEGRQIYQLGIAFSGKQLALKGLD